MRAGVFPESAVHRHGAYLLVGGLGLAALGRDDRDDARASRVAAFGGSDEAAGRDSDESRSRVAGRGGTHAEYWRWESGPGLDDRTVERLDSVSGERPTDGSRACGSSRPRRRADGGEGRPIAGHRDPGFTQSRRDATQLATFRGPRGAGRRDGIRRADRWDVSPGEGSFGRPRPLPGNNSPVVWEDRVFLSRCDRERPRGVSVSMPIGRPACGNGKCSRPWRATRRSRSPDDTGYAAPTMATDGRRVFAMFAEGDLAAFDVSGQPLWTRNLGVPKNVYGHASSLALAGELLIVQFDQGSKKEGKSKLLALHVQSGETVWETAREVPNSWSSPVVIHHEGQPRIITCAESLGDCLCRGGRTGALAGQVFASGRGANAGLLEWHALCGSEFPGISAIRAGGQGDVTESHVLWTAEFGAPDTCSPLVSDGLLMVWHPMAP